MGKAVASLENGEYEKELTEDQFKVAFFTIYPF